jgi:hypothetical protein
MINLLPPDVKSSYRYAHRNVILLRWVTAASFGLLGLIIISLAGFLYMQQVSNNYDSQIEAAQTSLKKQNLTTTQKQVQDVSSNLKLSVQVLSKEVLFSQLLKQIAVITPQNASLSNLDINQTSGALDITADTADYNAATQLQVNLSDPKNKLFSKADIENISCKSKSDNARYPCSVSIRALFAPNNPYLFINAAGS